MNDQPRHRFLQLHTLTSYGPANLNRDDAGMPKAVVVGGKERLRVSSQSHKRAWRTSSVFADGLETGTMGKRTKRVGLEIRKMLEEHDATDHELTAFACAAARIFGKIDERDILSVKTLVFVTHVEICKAAHLALVALQARQSSGQAQEICDSEPGAHELHELAKELLAILEKSDGKKSAKAVATKANEADLSKSVAPHVYQEVDSAVDVGMFGRMLAENTLYSREAAVQVAHAYTTHAVRAEDDYFTAVDDLKTLAEDAGAGHVNYQHFGAGVFYGYVCVDVGLLLHNLEGNKAVAQAAISALVRAACTVAPSGKQNSFASRAYASCALIERGNAQPRSLGCAFTNPVRGDGPDGMLAESVARLVDQRERMERAYAGFGKLEHFLMDVEAGAGSLSDVITFAKGAVE